MTSSTITSISNNSSGHLTLENNVHYIEGAHSTLDEQPDKMQYVDRHDAKDDLEKGRIKSFQQKNRVDRVVALISSVETLSWLYRKMRDQSVVSMRLTIE